MSGKAFLKETLHNIFLVDLILTLILVMNMLRSRQG